MMRKSRCAAAMAVLVGSVGVHLPEVRGDQILFGSDTQSHTLSSKPVFGGAWTPVGPTPVILGLAYDQAHDVMYGTLQGPGQLVRIDHTTGATVPIGAPGDIGLNDPVGLAWDPHSGWLFACSELSDQLIMVDPATGKGHSPVPLLAAGDIEGLAFSSSHNTLFGLDDAGGRIVTIDPQTGVVTGLPTSLPAVGLWRGLAYDSESDRLIASVLIGPTSNRQTRLYSIDPLTGASVSINLSAVGVNIHGLEVIPSPTTLLAPALMGALACRRRRRTTP